MLRFYRRNTLAQQEKQIEAYNIFLGLKLKLLHTFSEEQKEILATLEYLIQHDVFFALRLGPDLNLSLNRLINTLLKNSNIVINLVQRLRIPLGELLTLDPMKCGTFISYAKGVVQLVERAHIPFRVLSAIENSYRYMLLVANAKKVVCLINEVGASWEDLSFLNHVMLTELILYAPQIVQLNISWKHLLSFDECIRMTLYRYSNEIAQLVDEGVLTLGQVEHILNEKLAQLKALYSAELIDSPAEELKAFQNQLKQFFEDPESEVAEEFLSSPIM